MKALAFLDFKDFLSRFITLGDRTGRFGSCCYCYSRPDCLIAMTLLHSSLGVYFSDCNMELLFFAEKDHEHMNNVN